MRIKIDYEICAGHGLCVTAAPDLIEFESGDQPEVVCDLIASDKEDQAHRAEDACPERAITLIE